MFPPRLVIASLTAAFAVTFAVLILVGGKESGADERTASRELSLGVPSQAAASTDGRIAALNAAVRAEPKRPEGYTALAETYLQKARETADPAFYGRAGIALERALTRKPGDAAALTARGRLRLSLHDFKGALADARRALAAAPDANAPYPVLVDALVELGRYDDAERALQTMIDRRPGASAYARVAYLRELRGDLSGAAEALRLAVSASRGPGENAAYVTALLGDLEFTRGRLSRAATAYRDALTRLPRFPPAEAGLARLDSARGDREAAIRRLRRLVGRLPLPQYVVELGETELAVGRRARARRDLELLGAQYRLLRAAGVAPDAQIAVHEADYGDPRRAVRLARAVWASAPSVRSADALGWALTRTGRPAEGLRWARRALRLGSRDPRFLYHAGIAARQAGRSGDARRWLERALRQAPRFSAYLSPRARRALRTLGGSR
ncbi:MAG: tetratricopeptide repeat protein [Solirubrobacteraceae bacterium]